MHSSLEILRGSTHFENAEGKIVVVCDCSEASPHWSHSLMHAYFIPPNELASIGYLGQEIVFEVYDDE